MSIGEQPRAVPSNNANRYAPLYKSRKEVGYGKKCFPLTMVGDAKFSMDPERKISNLFKLVKRGKQT